MTRFETAADQCRPSAEEQMIPIAHLEPMYRVTVDQAVVAEIVRRPVDAVDLDRIILFGSRALRGLGVFLWYTPQEVEDWAVVRSHVNIPRVAPGPGPA